MPGNSKKIRRIAEKEKERGREREREIMRGGERVRVGEREFEGVRG